MNHIPSTRFFGLNPLRSATAMVCGALLLGSAAFATDKAAADPIEAQYQKDRAVCLSGKSNQDQATCLKEAGAAREEARRGDLADVAKDGSKDSRATYKRNARERCDGLPDADRTACLARMRGAGTVEGSAASGGILRELVTPVPLEKK